MAELGPLTQQQQALLKQYHQAREAWETGDWSTEESANTYSASIDACHAAGFDPFHHPAPQ